jgi:hypothetical protein
MFAADERQFEDLSQENWSEMNLVVLPDASQIGQTS